MVGGGYGGVEDLGGGVAGKDGGSRKLIFSTSDGARCHVMSLQKILKVSGN